MSGTRKTAVIAALALVVTFAAGFIAGAVVDRVMLFHRGPQHAPVMARAMIHRLDRHLDLDDRQRAQIHQILQRRHDRIVNGVQQEIDQANVEIEKLLTPAQRARFQELKLRLGPRMHRGDKGRTESTR